MLKYLSLVLILRRLIDVTFLIMAVLLVFPASFFRVFARIFKKQVLHFNPFRNTPPCVFKKKHDIVKIEGFTLKEYQCDTEDNVCVSFWRIIPEESIEIDEDKYSTYVKLKKRKPVLIQHGLLDCSMSWFLLQKSENCLPFILARKGYDVWVSNNRGTKYSSKNNHQDQYWQYNLDHIVKYDVPSIINFVINQTRSDKIIYIGHSQGTTQFFTALDIHPQLGSKIECFIGLGPVLSLKNVNNHLYLKLLDKLKICQVLKFLGFKALLTLSPWMNRLVGFMLSNSWIFYKICQRIVSGICGYNKQPNKVDALRFSVILSHQPGGSSVNNVIHWVQIYRHGYIRKFDYGMKKNKEIYGSAIPPSYSYDSLNKMPFQFHLFRGTSDHIITDKDFKYLTQKLPEQKFQVYHVQDFAHLDYLWAQQAPKLIYQKILKILNQNNQQNEKQNQVDLQQTKDMTQDNSDKSENSYLSKVDVV